ncbi:MAG: D-glycerate dehydrogenase [bacterium]|nr:D-glycerate dehydrogenase [bacterium]
MNWNIFITREIPKEAIDLLKANCDTVEVHEGDSLLRREQLLEKVRGRDSILCCLTEKIDAEVLAAASGVKGIANMAVGYDNIDVKAATKQGIPVSNTPGVLTDATADLAWALLFAAARRIIPADKYTRAGEFKAWGPMLFLGADVTGKTLGIIGAGRIGTAVAMRSRGFGMSVLYCDPVRNDFLEKELSARLVSLEELLREADFVSLHVNLTPETRHLIGERELGLIKPTAYLINTSRGPVVDEEALVGALQKRQIAGAGMDVYEQEPRLAPGLAELDNVVLLPHIGSATIATRTKMALIAADNLLAMLRGEPAPNCVNPEVYKRGPKGHSALQRTTTAEHA